MTIPLFDSLSHPTLTGQWSTVKGREAGFASLVELMTQSNFSRACAIGLAGVEGYQHAAFAKACAAFPQLVPVAGVDPGASDLAQQLDQIRELGFPAIKIHPRLSRIDLGDDTLATTFIESTRRNLVVFLCTYQHAPVERYPLVDPLYRIVAAMKQAPTTRLVLVHGGDVELLRYVQFARHSPNILVDLSYTILKYRGSSIDLDIEHLSKHFNRRTCIGVDHPEFTHAALRDRFEELASRLNRAEAENIGFRNLQSFLNLPEA